MKQKFTNRDKIEQPLLKQLEVRPFLFPLLDWKYSKYIVR